MKKFLLSPCLHTFSTRGTIALSSWQDSRSRLKTHGVFLADPSALWTCIQLSVIKGRREEGDMSSFSYFVMVAVLIILPIPTDAVIESQTWESKSKMGNVRLLLLETIVTSSLRTCVFFYKKKKGPGPLSKQAGVWRIQLLYTLHDSKNVQQSFVFIFERPP